MLETIRQRGALLTCYLDDGVFQSLIRHVDLPATRLILERSPTEAANKSLLARSRCSFHCDVPDWHIEFVAAAPHEVAHDGRPALELRFPEVLVAHQPRAHPRAPVLPHVPLFCVADAGGIMPFDASMVDIGHGGLGFLVYAVDIGLEPGTILRGCKVETPAGDVLHTDLEVRYSQRVTLSDGTRALRSGCRFINPTPEIIALVRSYTKEKA